MFICCSLAKTTVSLSPQNGHAFSTRMCVPMGLGWTLSENTGPGDDRHSLCSGPRAMIKLSRLSLLYGRFRVLGRKACPLGPWIAVTNTSQLTRSAVYGGVSVKYLSWGTWIVGHSLNPTASRRTLRPWMIRAARYDLTDRWMGLLKPEWNACCPA